MATRCPFGWKSRFQSNLSILEAKNVSAPCATQETLGQTLLRDTFTALYQASSGFFLLFFCLQFCHYNYILLILFTNIKPYIFFCLGKVVFVLREQDLSSPINIAIDGSVLPYFPQPAHSLPLHCSLLRFILLFEPKSACGYTSLKENSYAAFVTLTLNLSTDKIRCFFWKKQNFSQFSLLSLFVFLPHLFTSVIFNTIPCDFAILLEMRLSFFFAFLTVLIEYLTGLFTIWLCCFSPDDIIVCIFFLSVSSWCHVISKLRRN